MLYILLNVNIYVCMNRYTCEIPILIRAFTSRKTLGLYLYVAIIHIMCINNISLKTAT